MIHPVYTQNVCHRVKTLHKFTKNRIISKRFIVTLHTFSGKVQKKKS